MVSPIKAALLSAFLLPGCGHYLLKKKMLALSISGLFIVGVYLITRNIISVSNIVVEKIQAGEVAMNIIAITSALNDVMVNSTTNIPYINYIVGAVWLFSIVDSFRIAKNVVKQP